MKRNLVITIQVSFDSDLPTSELDERIREFVKERLPQIRDAEPVGTYLVSIAPGPRFNFPRSNLRTFYDELSDDIEADRRRAIEKAVQNDLDWEDDESNG